jgi:translation elongation factor EF-1beta
LLDIKPWDDETDMKEMERLVRTIEMEGLVWGAGKWSEMLLCLTSLYFQEQ